MTSAAYETERLAKSVVGLGTRGIGNTDLTLYYKIIHNLNPSPINRLFQHLCALRQTHLTESRTNFYISAPLCRTVAYQRDFFHRYVSRGNNLPTTVNIATSLQIFKSGLARVDQIYYLRYRFLPLVLCCFCVCLFCGVTLVLFLCPVTATEFKIAFLLLCF